MVLLAGLSVRLVLPLVNTLELYWELQLPHKCAPLLSAARDLL